MSNKYLSLRLNTTLKVVLYMERQEVFKKRLRELRKENNESLDNLSKNTGISVSALSRYERGERNPKFEQVVLLANHFNVDEGYLMGTQDQKDVFSKLDRSIEKMAEIEFSQTANAGKEMVNLGQDAPYLIGLIAEIEKAAFSDSDVKRGAYTIENFEKFIHELHDVYLSAFTVDDAQTLAANLDHINATIKQARYELTARLKFDE